MHKSEHVSTRERFDTAQVASNYAQGKNTRITRKNQREMQCIETALTGVPPGSLVLDLPAGTGRLLPMLLNRGYQVLAGDYSEHMLTQAKLHCESEIPASEHADRLQFARLPGWM